MRAVVQICRIDDATSPYEKSTKMPNFDLFIKEKLSTLSKQTRMVAKKRIMNVIFEIKMSPLKEYEHEGPVVFSGAAAPMLILTQNPNLFHQINRSSTPYVNMMSSN